MSLAKNSLGEPDDRNGHVRFEVAEDGNSGQRCPDSGVPLPQFH